MSDTINSHSHNSPTSSSPPINPISSISITKIDTDIINPTTNQTIIEPGLVIVNQQGTNADGSEITHTTFNTTDNVNNYANINENLVGQVTSYYDDELTGESSILINEIRLYAGKIKCSDFHGKGTIDDYTELFTAATKIANETKQMLLDIDVDGFTEFGTASDDLAALFNSFIVKLQTVSIIDDTNFLRAVSIALHKIWNLSEVFGRFKETILATSTVQLPKSAHDTKVLLEGVMSELNCAMTYIGHFVAPSSTDPLDASLSSIDKNIISKAVDTIDNWNVLCNQGVTIAMSNNSDILYIKQTNSELKNKTSIIQNASKLLKTKLTQFTTF